MSASLVGSEMCIRDRASTALVRPLPGGKRCISSPWGASDSSAGKPARVAFKTLSSMSGASCTGATSPSRGTTQAWAWSETS
eukprot:2946227-Alexandrium_andersonii.AAC.1